MDLLEFGVGEPLGLLLSHRSVPTHALSPLFYEGGQLLVAGGLIDHPIHRGMMTAASEGRIRVFPQSSRCLAGDVLLGRSPEVGGFAAIPLPT
jgi:hypothetical protein